MFSRTKLFGLSSSQTGITMSCGRNSGETSGIKLLAVMVIG